MSLHRLGETRSRRTQDHLLHTPDTFVWAPLPGMKHATACVHAAPALGAAFTQYTAILENGGELGGPSIAGHSRFVYVLEGTIEVFRHGPTRKLSAGGFSFHPSEPHTIKAIDGPARISVIEKPYIEINPTFQAKAVSGRDHEIVPTFLNGDGGLRVRSLMPPDPIYDFAVNTMEYDPGASLSMVEVHVMEHGLLMLEGDGIYRLGESWYPVTKGDFIWMGPYCPQWFGALGKKPAKYLIYKDWNRHPAQVSQ